MRRMIQTIALSLAGTLALFAGCSGFEMGPAGTYPSTSSGGGGQGGGGESACTVEDGQCDVLTETCACSDCKGTAFCVEAQCIDDGYCTYDDACICDDCLKDVVCGDPAGCKDDGTCDSFFEGCVCDDCTSEIECLDNPPDVSGGSGSGGGGGGGDGGGSAGGGGMGGGGGA
jgi:hypothetical protein